MMRKMSLSCHGGSPPSHEHHLGASTHQVAQTCYCIPLRFHPCCCTFLLSISFSATLKPQLHIVTSRLLAGLVALSCSTQIFQFLPLWLPDRPTLPPRGIMSAQTSILF
ncbi:hypothetical protein TorRG33x02_229520 [Trema orientale]|uniref:Uncharacterized protein n=1 Tax=Trema orientale TaxID=63057 RepID=A0A2P5E6M5_TREOI|nr:hypothetical protein TorRG33x02_229520 [Trema orientale]